MSVRPHLMRCMLTANLAVDMRFANGTQVRWCACLACIRARVDNMCMGGRRSPSQGRLFYWTPGNIEAKKALPSSHPELLARFAKEASVKKSELFSDIDTIDVQARQETLKVRGEPQLLQLPIVPAYALTIHKTQALSIKHRVNGCLEASFPRANLSTGCALAR